MSGVGKPSDIQMEQSTFSASAEVKPSKSRSFTAPNAVFQSVHQCSLAPKAHSLHNLVRKCPSSPVATDAGSANDEVNSIDLSDNESCIRSTSCDADTVLLDGSSDCESASLNGLSSQGITSDAEACDEESVSCVYSVMLLLQLRAGCMRSGSPCPVKYSARSVDDLPADAAQPAAEERKKLQGKLLPASGPSSKATPTQPAASPPRSSFAAAAANRSDDEKVARAARSILNKLTVEKFDALHEKLATCGVKTPEQMALLMKEIFEKATEQHHFVAMYADLCVRLEGDSRLSGAVGKEKDGDSSNFRRLLLGQCQTAFEKLFEPQLQPAAAADEDPELEDRRKRRKLGNVKLVGHLLVRGMLNSRLLVECADALLSSRSSCPEALESLAALLTITGPKFDQKEWRGKERLDAVFTTVTALTKDKSVPTRVRFLLQDVLDLKRRGWQANGATSEPKGPMRLEEVKKQAEKTLVPDPGPTPTGARKPVLPLRRPPMKDKSFPEETPKSHEGGRSFKADRVKPSDSFGRLSTKDFSPLSQASTAASTPKCDITPKKALTPANKTGTKITRASFGQEQPEAVPAPSPAPQPPAPGPFSLKDFHRELSSTLRDLGADLNVVAAVRRVRTQNVPLAHHSGEFVDIITRAAEEKRGPARRSMFAFAAGLMAAEDSAFDRSKCLAGVNVFFKEVYEELCLEVPRLQQIVSAELLPALKSVASSKDLAAVIPDELKSVL